MKKQIIVCVFFYMQSESTLFLLFEQTVVIFLAMRWAEPGLDRIIWERISRRSLVKAQRVRSFQPSLWNDRIHIACYGQPDVVNRC
jgi:hypothetical protein